MSQAPSSNVPAAVPAAAPAPQASGGASAKPIIPFDKFAEVDLRVAKIIQAENHPTADKLLKLQLDDGSGHPRQICAGIRANYPPDELVGKLIVIVANLAPRMIRGEESRGMLLAASDVPRDAPDAGAARRVVFLTPAGDVQPGATVS